MWPLCAWESGKCSCMQDKLFLGFYELLKNTMKFLYSYLQAKSNSRLKMPLPISPLLKLATSTPLEGPPMVQLRESQNAQVVLESRILSFSHSYRH